MSREIDALLNLLQDEDPQVVAAVMEKLLKTDEFVNCRLAELQESSNPLIRERIHQLESILHRKQLMHEFLNRIKNNEIGLWDDLIFLNKIMDGNLSDQMINEAWVSLQKKVSTETLSTMEMAALMRENCFTAPADDVLEQTLRA